MSKATPEHAAFMEERKQAIAQIDQMWEAEQHANDAMLAYEQTDYNKETMRHLESFITQVNLDTEQLRRKYKYSHRK